MHVEGMTYIHTYLQHTFNIHCYNSCMRDSAQGGLPVVLLDFAAFDVENIDENFDILEYLVPLRGQIVLHKCLLTEKYRNFP